MKKLALMIGVSTMLATPAMAQDTILIDEDDRSVITGSVQDIRFETIIVDVNGQDIEVDIDDLDIRENKENYFPVGSRVRVVGDLDDGDEMDATEMIRIDDGDLNVEVEAAQ